MTGSTFGNYQLLELIGRGGMGEVWRAYDTATDRIVAIKVLPKHLAQDQQYLQRFRREAQAAARLNSPHVVPIHTYGDIDGQLFVDMRLIEGRDLEAVLKSGPLQPERAVRVVEQIAKALNAAHKVGLIHRDVKPSNILLDDDDFAYLIDFGIARGVDEAGLTSTGAMIGTWHYMAPERLRGEAVDARADIYALACILYECLTGTRPFPGDTLESQVAAHLTSPPPQPSRLRPDLPRGLDTVVAVGMAKNAAERYFSTIDLAHAARNAVTVSIPPVGPSPRPPQVRGRRTAVLVGAAAVALLVVATVVVVLSASPDSTDASVTSPSPKTTSPPAIPSSSVPAAVTESTVVVDGEPWPIQGEVSCTTMDRHVMILIDAGEGVTVVVTEGDPLVVGSVYLKTVGGGLVYDSRKSVGSATATVDADIYRITGEVGPQEGTAGTQPFEITAVCP